MADSGWPLQSERQLHTGSAQCRSSSSEQSSRIQVTAEFITLNVARQMGWEGGRVLGKCWEVCRVVGGAHVETSSATLLAFGMTTCLVHEPQKP